MRRLLLFICAAIFSLFTISARSELVISDFSPGANPFEAGGMFVSVRQNPDGTQSIRKEPDGLLHTSVILPSPLDLTDGGKYNAIALTAKREPSHSLSGYILLRVDTLRNEHTAWAVFRYEDFKMNEFSTVVYPFSNFYPGIDVPGNFRPLDFTKLQYFAIYQGPNNDAPEFHFTFDRLSAVAVPEPSSYGLIFLGAAAVLFGRRMKL